MEATIMYLLKAQADQNTQHGEMMKLLMDGKGTESVKDSSKRKKEEVSYHPQDPGHV